MIIRPKKSLGQHFLKNDDICARISDAITVHEGYKKVLEVGPGMGALTQHLLRREDFETSVVELDRDSVAYLNVHFSQLRGRILEQDFLHMKLDELFGEQFAVVGNYPYNISSQIVFKILDYKEHIPEMVGMFQKEVARRFASGPGSKEYGIISVLVQAHYNVEYLFTVDENEFIPPPKVKSGVIRMTRKTGSVLGCDEKLFKIIIKTGFNQRRKTLRNSLKSLLKEGMDTTLEVFNKRPEQLGLEQFVELTKMFEKFQ